MKYSKRPGRYSELRMGLYRGYCEGRNIVNYKDALLSITLCSDSYNCQYRDVDQYPCFRSGVEPF